jgi:thioredoxin 1
MSYRRITDFGENTAKVGISKTQTENRSHVEVFEVFSKEDKDTLIRDNTLAIFDIYATWCHPCNVSAPLYADMSEKYGELVSFAKEQVELRLSESVQVIPTFQVYHEGKLVKLITGPDMDAIEAEIKKYLFKDDKPARPVRRRGGGGSRKKVEPKKEEEKKEEGEKKDDSKKKGEEEQKTEPKV